jgi:hypothetical protein
LQPGSSRGAFLLPRQLAPRAVCGSSQGHALVSGVSSFAFQVRQGKCSEQAAGVLQAGRSGTCSAAVRCLGYPP